MVLADYVKNFELRNANFINTKEELEKVFRRNFEHIIFDKLDNLYQKLSRDTHHIIFGQRGVGKTLYLKKIKYDYLYNEEFEILPLFVDLTQMRDFLKDLDKIDLSNEIKVILFKFYFKFLLISDLLKISKEYIALNDNGNFKKMKKKIETFLREIIGLERLDISTEEYLDETIKNFKNPINLTEISNEGIIFINPIKNMIERSEIELGKMIKEQDLDQIFKKMSEKLGFSKFIILLDEFSMLSEEWQNNLASLLTDYLKNKIGSYDLKFKISIMEGRYLVDQRNNNFHEEFGNEIRFEIEFMKNFQGKGADSKLLMFYKNILLNRIDIVNEYDIFVDFQAFRNICYFSGFKVRDFLSFMYQICERNGLKSKITTNMVYDICNGYYRNQLSRFSETVNIEYITSYMKELGDFLKSSTNQLYFLSSDYSKNFFQVLLYYKIFAFVSFSTREKSDAVDIRGILLDFSTAIFYDIIKKSDLYTMELKYLNFSNAQLFNSNPISNKDLSRIKKLLKIGNGLQEIAEIFDFPIDFIQNALNIEEEQSKFEISFSSENLVEDDTQVVEDKSYDEIISELVKIPYIGIFLATELFKFGFNATKFLELEEDSFNNLYRKINPRIRGSLTRSYRRLIRE